MSPRDQLPDDVAQLLATEQFAPGPPAGAKARVLERIDATLSGGGGGPDGGGGASSGGASASSSGLVPVVSGWPAAVAAIASLVVGVVVGVGYSGARDVERTVMRKPVAAAAPAPAAAPATTDDDEATATADEPTATADDETATADDEKTTADDEKTTDEEASDSARAAEPARAADAASEDPPDPSAPAATSRAPVVQPADTLAAEQALLEQARAAVATDAAAARAPLTEHERRFPRGQLAEEREALLVLALARAGETTAARKRADRFFERWPSSLHAAMVHAALSR